MAAAVCNRGVCVGPPTAGVACHAAPRGALASSWADAGFDLRRLLQRWFGYCFDGGVQRVRRTPERLQCPEKFALGGTGHMVGGGVYAGRTDCLARRAGDDGGGDGDDEDKDKDKDENKDEKNDSDEKQDKDEKNKDKGDQDDKNEGDDKEDQDGKPKDDKGDQNNKNPKEDKGKPQQQPGKLSPQQVKNLLEAMNNEEKKVQEKMNASKTKGVKVKTDKDW